MFSNPRSGTLGGVRIHFVTLKCKIEYYSNH